ncbi:peptide chain release factor N(5)-glutamine methyltransferase [Coralloluteibacterium thermophilus]|uniref:Release factor glutamine methyltransferase n=1 Tax=Coralloluteibacterium thermophilum TaxID=2707049 RepID=A0ABV9NRB2_9GAMM
MRTVRDLIDDGASRLGAGDSPQLDAELLLAHALGRSRTWLVAHRDDVPDADAVAQFGQLLARRIAGEPVAYLLGARGFWSLELAVEPAVLIPRPETERLVELALDLLPADREVEVADLGTGSGAIALAIACERPHARVLAVDASAEALAVARRNAEANRIANVAFAEGDWFSPLAGRRFDLVASNPPYIAEDDPHLEQGDLRHEPRGALASGADGLDALRRIVAEAPAHLRPGGWLLVEHGFAQGQAVRDLFAAAAFEAVTTERDLEDRERVTLGRRAEQE